MQVFSVVFFGRNGFKKLLLGLLWVFEQVWLKGFLGSCVEEGVVKGTPEFSRVDEGVVVRLVDELEWAVVEGGSGSHPLQGEGRLEGEVWEAVHELVLENVVVNTVLALKLFL